MYTSFDPNICYMTTTPDVKNPKNNMEVTLHSQSVDDFSKAMDKYGYIYDGYTELSADKASQYLQALNGILPKKAAVDTELDSNHSYVLSNRGAMLQVWDRTDDKPIVNVLYKSMYSE